MVEQIGPGIFMIDAHMFGAPENLSTYVIPDPLPTLVEPGPTTCHDAVLSGLAEMGVDEIAQVIATHIHLDHAGGTGHLTRRFPRSDVYVHEVGAPHLVDPAKLTRSAQRIYGAQKMQELWGDIAPVEAARVRAVADGDRIEVGPTRNLEVMYTPGHAQHHMCLVDSDTGIAMIGDSVGLTFPETDIVHPLVPPPDVDVELLISQFDRYRQRNVPALAFAHFGLKVNVEGLLEESERRLRMWTDIAIRHKDERPEAVGRLIEEANLGDLRAGGHPDPHTRRMQDRTEFETDARGLLRYAHTHTHA